MSDITAEEPKKRGRPAKVKSQVEFPGEPLPKQVQAKTKQDEIIAQEVTEEDGTANKESHYVRFYHYGYGKPCVRYFEDIEKAKEFCANENNRWRVRKGHQRGTDGKLTPLIEEMSPFFIQQDEINPIELLK